MNPKKNLFNLRTIDALPAVKNYPLSLEVQSDLVIQLALVSGSSPPWSWGTSCPTWGRSWRTPRLTRWSSTLILTGMGVWTTMSGSPWWPQSRICTKGRCKLSFQLQQSSWIKWHNGVCKMVWKSPKMLMTNQIFCSLNLFSLSWLLLSFQMDVTCQGGLYHICNIKIPLIYGYFWHPPWVLYIQNISIWYKIRHYSMNCSKHRRWDDLIKSILSI